jgi:replicative DNA helicase
MSRDLFNIDAEHGLLGAILLDPSLFDDITAKVWVADFYDEDNAVLFQAMIACQAGGDPIDPVTVSLYQQELPYSGSTLAFAANIARNVPSSANWKTYARVVSERAVLRRLVDAAAAVTEMASEEAPLADVIARAQQAMADLRDLDDGDAEYKRLDEIIDKNLEVMDDKVNHRVLAGVRTGLADLDKMIKCLKPKTVTVIGGLPGSGKTTLGMQICQHNALNGHGTALVFSLEMPEEELGNRMLASVGGIDFGRIDIGTTMEDGDWAKLTGAVAKIKGSPLFVSDKSGLTLSRIRSIARTVQKRHGLGILAIDYIGLIKSEEKAQNRTAELSRISTGIVSLAKELNVPIVLLAQLNRESTKRPGKKPLASDLKDCGQIEADAHMILLVHRDPETEEGQNGVTEIIMPKCRHAKVGSCLVQQQGKFLRFVRFAGAREVSQEEVEIGRNAGKERF